LPRVVDQDIDPAEPVDSSLNGCRGVGGVRDVELCGQDGFIVSQGRCDGVGASGGGDDGVAGRQGSSGDVDTHPAAGAGDEPDLLFSHRGSLPL
jgi:hypothetical protein